MQINQLPTIPQAPADADVLAIEVNGVTYKVSKQALADAIATNITPDDIGALPDDTPFVSGVKGNSESSYRSGKVNITPENIGAFANTDVIDIPHGGTNGTTVQEAKANLNLGTQTQNFRVGVTAGANQAFGMGCVVDNANYSARNGHRLTLIPKEDSIALYDATEAGYVWNIPADVARRINLGASDTTAAAIYAKLSALATSEVATIYINTAAANVLTNGKVASSCYGTVLYQGSNSYRFFVGDVAVSGTGPYIYRFISTVTASAITAGNAYRYTGTAI